MSQDQKPLDEFSLIRDYFLRSLDADRGTGKDAGGNTPGVVVLGIGDDCAVLRPSEDEDLVVTTDTLVEGVHFPAGCRGADIAQRALRVNVSDIAAMGAEPRCFQLALTLPEADTEWLQSFSAGLHAAADEFSCVLTGGDTTRGPLVITITMFGAVAKGGALTRSGASVGDKVFVSGSLGRGAAGLSVVQSSSQHASTEFTSTRLSAENKMKDFFWCPEPRVQLGQHLRHIASAMIDISDGLVADLGHIAQASDVAAVIHRQRLPLPEVAVKHFGDEQMREWALSGGDDYELCFTVPPEKLDQLAALRAEDGAGGLPQITEIGELVPGTGVQCLDAAGNSVTLERSGYAHF
ncbi:MAG: thiamine-phosphate kinase [Porticoccaceae bacterium]|nr:thiamine-phosphate kinase [Porticoccaceae bacterium]